MLKDLFDFMQRKFFRNNENAFTLFFVVGIANFILSLSIILYFAFSVVGKYYPLYNLLPKSGWSVFLFVETASVCVIYCFAFIAENLWANTFYRKYIPIPNFAQVLVPLTLGAVLATLLILVNYSKYYSILYFIYTLVDVFGCMLYLFALKGVVGEIIADKNDLKTQAVYKFYVGRPWGKWGVIKIVASATALVFGLVGYEYLTYIVLIIVIAMNEVLWWSARYVLYRDHDFIV